MSIIQGSRVAGGDGGYQIQRSLRFRASASAYLSHTNAIAGNRRLLVWSGWVKRGQLGIDQTIVGTSEGGATAGYGVTLLRFLAGDQLKFVHTRPDTGGELIGATTSAVFRDPGAWYHVVIKADTAQATNSAGIKLYVNGVEQALTFSSYTQNSDLYWTAGNTINQYLGRWSVLSPANYLDSYLFEVNFIDGQALTPSSFGEINPTTGQWVAKKYTGTYGTNGFYLPFDDITSTTTLGYDKSGNGNNWTPSGISLTAGVTYDSMLDVPSGNAWDDGGNGRGNYCVLNPLINGTSATISQANQRIDIGATQMTRPLTATMAMSSGLWYWETYGTWDTAQRYLYSGILEQAAFYGTSPAPTESRSNVLVPGTGQWATQTGATRTAWGSKGVSGYATLMHAFDATTGKIWFGAEGVWFNSGDPAQGVNPIYTGIPAGVYYAYLFMGDINNGTVATINFGQRPFAYTPPTGFKALHTGNLPTPSIIKPSDHFDVVLATGANIKTTAEALYPGNFFEWIKDRANVNNHQLIDTVRGSSAVLQSNTTAAETTYVAPSGSSVGWAWKAGGAAVSNTAGSIASQVSANVAAGVSVVTYTGTGANATVGHGLGVAPKMVVVRNRGNGFNWATFHAAGGTNKTGYLNLADAFFTSSLFWNSTDPTSTVFSVGTFTVTNQSASPFIAYCFAEIPGFSKFGSVTMNSSADGAYFDTGFDTELLIMKRTDVASNWIMIDSTRQTYNVMGPELYPNLTNAEAIVTELDFTAGAIKFRNSALAGTWIIAAWARSPFKFANAR